MSLLQRALAACEAQKLHYEAVRTLNDKERAMVEETIAAVRTILAVDLSASQIECRDGLFCAFSCEGLDFSYWPAQNPDDSEDIPLLQWDAPSNNAFIIRSLSDLGSYIEQATEQGWFILPLYLPEVAA